MRHETNREGEEKEEDDEEEGEQAVVLAVEDPAERGVELRVSANCKRISRFISYQ